MNPKDFYDRTAEIYDGRHDNATARRICHMEEKLIKKYTNGLVLDIGCGTGGHLKFADWIGIDVSKNMLATARKKSDVNLSAARAEFLPFRDESLDSLCMFNVLNLCDAEQACREAARVVKRNGVAIVSATSAWDRKNISFFRRLFSKPVSFQKNVRIEKSRLRFHLFSRNELIGLFAGNGFTLLHFDGLYSLQQPYWGWHREFTLLEKFRLKLERVMPKHPARVYFCVFRRR
ncbi:MAG: class I SAM-dependent methyltransferase [Candidatus Aenigmarchaeota archaeon]|nr:class I SAM-dependent methyltransferase [Candidatus Aenigmarchaeota archaeon]MDI6722219.1 class I SAM-dependent methyltransferase [Candidatus Aenigmarchaeota archaeon]